MKLEFEIMADGKKIKEYIKADGVAECIGQLETMLNACYYQWEILKIKKIKKEREKWTA